MLFSVLIANYNNSQYLDTAITSVLRQTYTNWEIIVVDDGSTDNFIKVIQPYTSDKRIKVYRNEKNSGCGHTKRKCAGYATGELMAFLDPDDALHPDALQVMADAHEQFPECSLIHSTHFICDAKLNCKSIASYTRALPAHTPYLLLSDGSIHHFASFKRSSYFKTDGIAIQNKKAVDQDLYYKLEETGEILFIDKPLYYYRIHENSISTMGKEAEAALWHYAVIEEACQRRMQQNKSKELVRAYRTRFYKVRIINSFRRKQWFPFIYNSMVFPFVGGWSNMLSYVKKLPKERISLLRKSFAENHQIKV
jgi:glycosyltransferase involved in cell wall biosynthesis